MNEAVRRARLHGAREGERILAILDVRRRLLETHERVDVFDALAWLDVRVMFRPLNGLLGAYIRGDQPGVMITTNRPLSVQRFTAAHELGHAVLNHKPSLDSKNVLRRAASSQFGPSAAGFASALQEIEADAFAGAFLLPIWLITHHARKQGWTRSDLASEDIVYQLGLRCGASFQATVWALERNKIISAQVRSDLLNIKPKAIKAKLGHGAQAADTRADAWRLSLGDVGSSIPTVIGDTVSVALEQKAGSGYLWRRASEPPSQLTQLEVDVLVDRATVGASSLRSDLYRADSVGMAELHFAHRRPWEAQSIAEAVFSMTVSEPERGLSRANRARMIARGKLSRGFDVA